jgi:hypothetical protein
MESLLRPVTSQRSQRFSRVPRKESGKNKAFCIVWAGNHSVQKIVYYLYQSAIYYLQRKKALADNIMCLAVPNNQKSQYSYLSTDDLIYLYKKYGSWRKTAKALGANPKTFNDYKTKLLGKNYVPDMRE